MSAFCGLSTGLILGLVVVAGLSLADGSASDAVTISHAPSDRPVHTVRLRRLGDPDFSSVESILAAILRPGMTDREKAQAVYDFVRAHLFHWPAAREGDAPADYEFGVVYDPVKLLGVYGYGYCYQNRAVLEALWQAAGLDARSAGIGGHSVAEVFYDGRWHYLDADFHGYCLLDDGVTIASVEDIARRPDLLLAPTHRPDPFFPATQDPRVAYESLPILAGYFATPHDNFYQHDKVVLGHELNLTLLPGMRCTWGFTGDGRWNASHQTFAMERDIGYVDLSEGPRDRWSGLGYANGELLYQPDLTDRSSEFEAGVWARSNLVPGSQGLVSPDAEREGWAVFRIRLPYVIVGWPSSFTAPSPPQGAAVVAARFVRTSENARHGLDLSVDRGATWIALWERSGVGEDRAEWDLSPHVAARYEYWIRIRQSSPRPEAARLETFTARTAFQCAPRALPAIRAGDNDLIFQLGDETDVTEWRADLRGGTALSGAEEVENLEIVSGRLRSVGPTEGHAVFRFDAPPGGDLARAHLHLGCFREPHQTGPNDRIRLAVSHDAGRSWQPVWEDAYPGYAQHWCYHGNVPVSCPAGATSLWVRLTIRTDPSAAVRDFRVWMHWRPRGPGGVPPSGVRIVHRWKENGQARQVERILTTAPARYMVQAARDAEVVNEAVVLELVRARGLTWRDEEARARRPPTPDPGVNVERQKRMRELLRAIRDDPETGLAAAAAQTDFEYLARVAREALEVWRKFHPSVRP